MYSSTLRVAIGFALACASSTFACLNLHVPFNNQLMVGRTLELGDEYDWSVWVEKGDKAMNHHACLFAGVPLIAQLGLGIAVDGINVMGLTASALVLQQSQYQNAPKQSTSNKNVKSVAYYELVSFILRSFATVEETVEALSSGSIFVTPGSLLNNTYDSGNGLHWAIQDALGQAAILEYLNGELTVFNSTLMGVMTNDPDYEWHVKNMRAFAAMGNKFIPSNPDLVCGDMESEVCQWTSHGYNTLGLPGDLSPPGRFVRAYVMKQLAFQNQPPKTLGDSFVMINQVINAATFPKGAISPSSESEKVFDFPQFLAMKVPNRNQFYFRTYTQSTWKRIDLNKLFDSNQSNKLMHKSFPMNDTSLNTLLVTTDDDGIQSADITHMFINDEANANDDLKDLLISKLQGV